MSYEVLAQKWRPQSFNDVVSQTHITVTLKNQVSSGRIGHAYLFWGPRGTGKTTVARILAKAANCQQDPEDHTSLAEPCNNCQSCNEISSGRSVDVIEMDAASNRGIDPIRELRESARLTPAFSMYKIYIIDEAHMLTPEAFNALLKTLEEPPPHVIFILATTERHKIPQTITSRCQDYDFRYMEQLQITDRLRHICRAEEIRIDDEGLSLISQQSEGCLRDAQNILERLISSAGKELDLEQITQILNLGSVHLIVELNDAILNGDLALALHSLSNLAQQGADLTQCVNQSIRYFGDLRRLCIDSNLGNLVMRSQSEIELMQQKVKQVSADRLSRIIRIWIHTNSTIKQHGFARIHIESALIDACQVRSGIQLDRLLKYLKEIEDKIDKLGNQGGIQSDAARKNIAEVSPQGVDQNMIETDLLENKLTTGLSDEVSDKLEEVVAIRVKSGVDQEEPRFSINNQADQERGWQEALEILKRKKRSLYAHLRETKILVTNISEEEPNIFKIACERPVTIKMVNDNDKLEISDVLKSLFGIRPQIQLVRIDSKQRESQLEEYTDPPQSSHTAKQNSPRTQSDKTPMMLMHEASSDPELSSILRMFDAKIIKIEPK